VPPFLESTVTFKLATNGNGGTRLRIIHEADSAKSEKPERTGANSNRACVMVAA
jgi:hypothetical protein